ncbi:MAG TPA: hypothetical protein VFN38_07960 [Gemmatimonadaceae bacterium]|nr:hypothetical protein [Gemmatimonadaceae bacterium]
MANRTSTLALAALLAAVASLPAAAQSLATYGSAEVAGYGEGSLFLGSTLGLPGGRGLSPFVSAYVQTYRYRNGLNSHATATAFAPAVGLSDGMPTGSVSGSLGYNFTSTDVSNTPIVGLQGGNTGSLFSTLQANYWGDGNRAAQAIVSYAYRSQYVWSRLRAAQRVGASPWFAGGEVVYQGTSHRYNQHRYQVGPTIEYRFTPSFRMGGAAGYKGGDNNYPGTGYAQLNFLVLTDLGK